MHCPICEKPSSELMAPFCCSYCKNKDLLNWLNETYKIPVEDESNEQLPSEVIKSV